jgi:hypothetical protein
MMPSAVFLNLHPCAIMFRSAREWMAKELLVLRVDLRHNIDATRRDHVTLRGGLGVTT